MTQPLVTVAQAAEHFQVSLSTFHKWLKEGKIPDTAQIRVGKVRRFRISELEAALAASNSSPTH